MNNIRLLVISHNSFGQINNMGRTLEISFCGWDPNSIAQLYFTDEKPESSFCKRYYRITDFDVAKTLLGKRKAGGVIHHESSEHDIENINNVSIKQALTKKARNRTPLVYFTRNLLWKMGRWKSKELINWLDEFSPQAVFYASGDYAFSYRVALAISRERGIPLYISCYDDFYLGGYPSSTILGKHNFKVLMKTVSEAFEYAKSYFCICDAMLEDYSRLFGKEGHVLRTGALMSEQGVIPVNARERRVVYVGNLDYGRAEQLVVLGRTLKSLEVPDFESLHVYSGEIRKEILTLMSPQNGISFHGRVSSEKVQEILSTSMFVVHTESSMPQFVSRTKYSVSTKIADSLASGACIIAYGPKKVASISYIDKYNAAFVVNDERDLSDGLKTILSDASLREQITENAISLAKINHNAANNRKMLYDVINEV